MHNGHSDILKGCILWFISLSQLSCWAHMGTSIGELASCPTFRHNLCVAYTQVLIGYHILSYWDPHTDKIRCEMSVIGCITWCVGGSECFSQSQYTHCRRTNTIDLNINSCGISYKIYCSNIECLIIREVYRSPEIGKPLVIGKLLWANVILDLIE